MSQLSTAFSDLVLAAASVYGILQMTASSWDQYIYAVIGYALIWVAAVAGMIRFGIRHPPQIVVDVFHFFNGVVRTAAIALISAQFLQLHVQEEAAWVMSGIGVISLLVPRVLDSDDNEKFQDVAFLVAIMGLAYCCWVTKSLYGIAGTVVLMVGRFKDDLGSDDWYIYLRAAAVFLFYLFLLNDRSIDGFLKKYFM